LLLARATGGLGQGQEPHYAIIILEMRLFRFTTKTVASKPPKKVWSEKLKRDVCYKHYWGNEKITNCPDCGISVENDATAERIERSLESEIA
jgi:hypothetical protein